VGDALAVLDRARAERVVVVSRCDAGNDLILAVEHPERVAALVLIGPDPLLTDDPADQEGPYPFDTEPATLEDRAKWNRRYFLRDWPGFVEFFFAQMFTEPHSTKQIEDAIGWACRPIRRPSCAACRAELADTGRPAQAAQPASRDADSAIGAVARSRLPVPLVTVRGPSGLRDC
jgi:pimeloyl-ACP methyl ester carboxylesterase